MKPDCKVASLDLGSHFVTHGSLDELYRNYGLDGELIAETELLKRTKDIDCDVLKVAHHGSKTSTNYEFLKAATPEYAVISVGKDNSYNHPHSESITALEKANAEIYRTDYHGDIIFYIENGEIEIKTEKTGDYY